MSKMAESTKHKRIHSLPGGFVNTYSDIHTHALMNFCFQKLNFKETTEHSRAWEAEHRTYRYLSIFSHRKHTKSTALNRPNLHCRVRATNRHHGGGFQELCHRRLPRQQTSGPHLLHPVQAAPALCEGGLLLYSDAQFCSIEQNLAELQISKSSNPATKRIPLRHAKMLSHRVCIPSARLPGTGGPRDVCPSLERTLLCNTRSTVDSGTVLQLRGPDQEPGLCQGRSRQM